MLVGASRKSSIARIAGDASTADQRLGGSIAAALAAARAGVAAVRVHDVAETIQALAVAAAIGQRAMPAAMSEAQGRVLAIAGSDSGGGAGVQADIKTITALGGYAASAITAVTVQDTAGVHAIHPIPPAIVAAQIRAVLADIGADAIKTGMLGDGRRRRGGGRGPGRRARTSRWWSIR